MTRRQLISTAGAALMAASQSRILGANDRLSIALIGCGARGGLLQTHFQKQNGPFTAVCDVWRTRAEQASALAPGSKVIDDHRKVLELPGLDAVVIATSDHWHARIAMDALNAGKDVYVEKPLTRTIEEGAAIIDAARVNQRICQVGAQQRSGTHYIQARDEYIKAGKLGKIHYVRTWWTDGAGGGGGARANRPANAAQATGGHSTPVGIDASRQPRGSGTGTGMSPLCTGGPGIRRNFFNFRNYIDLCGGILTDKYVHWVDVVHMFMGEQGPVTADTAGGDLRRARWTHGAGHSECALRVSGRLGLYLHECCDERLPAGRDRVLRTEGHLRIDRTKFEFFPPERGAQPLVVECKTDLVEEHVRNFIDCCKSRKMPKRRGEGESVGDCGTSGESVVDAAAQDPLRFRA